MSTYHQEHADALRRKAATATRYTFTATGADLYDRQPYTPVDGTVVIKAQPRGCPRNGTMGQCYIADLTGRVIGMVDTRSLRRIV